ncbi:MAG TPA: NrfD/PsrC family molybdoenzyme membrane anchor subunit [Dehalococcoidia bacterium]|nr:NrfD/PsrC family molybdoenzyme membrane anchor subunit [Dehalococcoidia bacterium]
MSTEARFATAVPGAPPRTDGRSPHLRHASDARTAAILRPILERPSAVFLALLALAGAGLLWWAYAWSFQLRHGMIVAGIADWGTGGGVPWGFYVGSFIWWVGIAHGGIIISAAVRLFGLEAFKPVARMAEMLTLIALSIAALYIVIHIGRPDRVVTSVLPNLPQTIRTSPLAWDVTVITLYFVLTATYLGLTIRPDLYALRDRLPPLFAPVYAALLLGYRPEDKHKIERMAWWLALAVIVLAPLFLHGGVIPWLFATMPGQPGWFGGAQGPQFLTIALSSALGSVIIMAYVFRRAFRWEEILPDEVFAGLGRWLALFALLFLWMQLQQNITGSVAPPAAVEKVTHAKMEEPLYWLALGLVGLALAYLAIQMIFPRYFNVERTVIAALLPVSATLLEKTLFVVEGLMYPVFQLYEAVPGHYTPSWVELSSAVGAFSILVLFFLAMSRIVPLVEVEADGE